MKRWTYVETYASRTIFSKPKFLGYIDYQVFFPMAARRPLRIRESSAIKTGLVVIRRTTRRGYAGTTTNLPIVLNTQKIAFKLYHPEKILPTQKHPGIEDFYYPRHLRSGVRPFTPGQAYLKSRYCVGKNTLFNNLFVSILKVKTDGGINIPGYIHAQIKGNYKNLNIPPNIATRANTRGPFLFQCCRVVLNKEKIDCKSPRERLLVNC